jgi:hypothetical protein
MKKSIVEQLTPAQVEEVRALQAAENIQLYEDAVLKYLVRKGFIKETRP